MSKRYSSFGKARTNLVHTSQVWFTSRVRYNDEREEYKQEVQTVLKLSQNRWTAQKERVEKPPERNSFPCLSPLYYETHEIFHVSRAYFCPCLRTYMHVTHTHTHIRTYTYAQTYYAWSTARPCRADHPHGYSTAASAVLPRRKVFNGKAGLKKGSGGVNASADEETSGVISQPAKKLYFTIAATFKPPTVRRDASVRSLARSLARAQLCILSHSMHSKPRLRVPSSPFYRPLYRALRSSIL